MWFPDIRVERPVVIDAAVIAVIPIVLVTLHYHLPETTREAYFFQYHNPDVLSALVSGYLHRSWGHLEGNLVSFVLLISVVYTVFWRWGSRKLFWIVFTVVLLVTPIVTSTFDHVVMHLLRGGEGTTAGFSGVTHGFAGVLLSAVGLFTAHQATKTVGGGVAFGMFILGSWMLLMNLGGLTVYALVLLLAGLLLAAILATSPVMSADDLRDLINQLRNNAVNVILVAVAVFVFITSVGAGFPEDAAEDGVNILAHLTGLGFGVVLTAGAWVFFEQPDLELFSRKRKRDVIAKLPRRWILIGSFFAVVIIVLSVLSSVALGIVSHEAGALLMSAVLAVATFAYVILAFEMAGTMRDQTEHTQELFKLRRKDDVINLIQKQIRPIHNEIIRHGRTFNADGFNQYDAMTVGDTMYQRLPRLETEFGRSVEPASLSKDVDVDAGDVYLYYHTVSEYQDKYDRAVTTLSVALLNDINDLPIQSDNVQEYAESALSLEPVDVPRSKWNDVKHDVVPYRDQVRDLTGELFDLRNEIKEIGHELSKELGQAEATLRQEHFISESDMNAE